MSVLFILVGAGIIGWWLFARQLTAKPWEAQQSLADDQYGGAAMNTMPERTGLWIFLAVISSFFGLFMSAYSMRMTLPDWQPLAEPGLLWGNTLVLIISSAAFQWTRWAAERGDPGAVRAGLLASGFFTMVFLAGQMMAWNEINASGQFMQSNAAIAFFFLLTGLHGLHLVGGLLVWARTTVRASLGNSELGEIRRSVQLCTVYWHYLLLVWVVLFGLLLTT